MKDPAPAVIREAPRWGVEIIGWQAARAIRLPHAGGGGHRTPLRARAVAASASDAALKVGERRP